MTFSIQNLGAVAVALSLGLASPQSVAGAIANVLVGSGGDRFVPAVIHIAVGDEVVWTWSGSFHSTTSGTNGVPGDDNGAPSGLWDSGVHNVPFSFTNTFTSAGTFSYYCSLHYGFGMTGAVVVAAANAAPTVSITSPQSKAVFSAPADVTIQATASDSDGSVTNVQFRIGSTVLTNATAGPFSAIAANLAAGNYMLTAIATDNGGLDATNSVDISVVTPVETILSRVARLAPTNLQFTYSANTGLTYVVQLSTNLGADNWISLATNTAGSDPALFVDHHATNNPAFYRVGRLPNP